MLRLVITSCLLWGATLGIFGTTVANSAHANNAIAPKTPMVITHHYYFGENSSITTPNYEAEVILLAMQKTEDALGPFELKMLPNYHSNQMRSAEVMSTKPELFYLRTFGYEKHLTVDKNIAFIPFPVYLGMLSYRTCFTSKSKIKSINGIEDIFALRKFKIGQGIGWADNAVLRHNGLQVTEINSNESLFQMTALGRVDLFCRGANEVQPEYQRYIHRIKHLAYDRSMALYYPMPLFFYMNKENKREIERVKLGLALAHKDGSLQALWEKHFGDALSFVQMDKRKIFKLDNPELSNLESDIERFFYVTPNN